MTPADGHPHLTQYLERRAARRGKRGDAQLTLLGEQLLLLERIERSLETLMSLTLRMANALEALADVVEERRKS